VVDRDPEGLAMGNGRFWTSGARFWSGTPRKHRRQVWWLIHGGFFLHPILWSKNIWSEILGLLCPYIRVNIFRELLELRRASRIPWLCFRKSIIAIYLKGLSVVLLRSGIHVKMGLYGESRGRGLFLIVYSALINYIRQKRICLWTYRRMSSWTVHH
jgi:hypothetical protein